LNFENINKKDFDNKSEIVLKKLFLCDVMILFFDILINFYLHLGYQESEKVSKYIAACSATCPT